LGPTEHQIGIRDGVHGNAFSFLKSAAAIGELNGTEGHREAKRVTLPPPYGSPGRGEGALGDTESNWACVLLLSTTVRVRQEEEKGTWLIEYASIPFAELPHTHTCV